jgi:taurine dioxygenase
MRYETITVRPYSTALGAEVLDVDLSRPLAEGAWREIARAFREFLVLFFRDQEITPEQQIAFARRFGDLEPYPFVDGMEDYPELIEIVKLPTEVQNFGSGWHVDMSYREIPPAGAVLLGVEVPPVGGDTMFANLCLAYESLSDGMKSLLERLRGVHASDAPGAQTEKLEGMDIKWHERPRQAREQPLLRVHPETGRKSLFISPDYCSQLAGMSLEESRALIGFLERHATRPEFTCRFRWRPKSIAVWDNRCVMHNALDDDLAARRGGSGFRRVMRRATIKSVTPS